MSRGSHYAVVGGRGRVATISRTARRPDDRNKHVILRFRVIYVFGRLVMKKNRSETRDYDRKIQPIVLFCAYAKITIFFFDINKVKETTTTAAAAAVATSTHTHRHT